MKHFKKSFGLSVVFKWMILLYGFLLFTAGFLDTCEAKVYEVGPGKTLDRISKVPFDSLEPGDVVKIYYRKRPYKEKILLRKSGTKRKPIIIKGISEKGKLPVIDGTQAVQFQNDLSDQSGRWLIKAGDKASVNYVGIYNLHLKNANNSQQYIMKNKPMAYKDNAAGVFVKFGKFVIISKCVIHSCGMGVQTSYGPNVENVTINQCMIYDNGNFKNSGDYLGHNVYLCGVRTIVQFSNFRANHSDGNNIKDRGQHTILRYNWIEGGLNRQLDLVEHDGYKNANAYVYGNVIVQDRTIHNRNMIHFGGDSGGRRSGTLFFFNNTVVGKSKATLYFVNRFSDGRVWLSNNVFLGSGRLWKGKGRPAGSNNWFSQTITMPLYMELGEKGTLPGFIWARGIPYLPGPVSPLVNKGTNRLPFKVGYSPRPGGGAVKRFADGWMDIGAYEFRIK